MLKLGEKNKFYDDLNKIAKNVKSPQDVLFDIKEEDLISLLSSNFINVNDQEVIGRGDSILPGDVSGQLILDRQLGESLLQEAKIRNTSIDLIYSCNNGNLEDFYVLKSSKGFFTNQKGRTTFCPVQASCEGVPTLVGVNCDYQKKVEISKLTYTFNNGSKITIEQL